MPDAINPVRCWLRHVRRTAAGETGTTIANATFIRGPINALNGLQGWQSGRVAVALADTGELTIVLPNAVGDDGIAHKKRFAYFTRDDYRPGEEWIEVYRDADTLLSVCTPYRGRKSTTTLELVGYDVAGLLNKFRGSELDVWDGHAPRDVFEHATRAPALVYGTDFAGFAGVPYDGWSAPAGGVTVSPTTGKPRIKANTGPPLTSGQITRNLPAGTPSDCWTCEVHAIAVGALDGFELELGGVNATFEPDGTVYAMSPANAAPAFPLVYASGPLEDNLPGKRQGFSPVGLVSLRIVARYDRMFIVLNGELVCEWRRETTTALDSTPVYVRTFGTLDVTSFHVEALLPFAMRGTDKGDRRLPGIPPPGGLRARYYNAAPLTSRRATTAGRLSLILPLAAEPTSERLEPTLDQAGTPPGIPGAYVARWVGSIYLDLAASERRVRIVSAGPCRVYIGRTMRNVDRYIDAWAAASGTYVGGVLRTHLGAAAAGWYPIIVEGYRQTVGGGWRLEDAPTDAAGNITLAYATVPASRLSPVGVVEEHWRYESMRSIIDSLTETFGYQWRTDPYGLESGLFPGQIVPRLLVGRMTNRVIRDFEGVDVVVDSDASDTVDTLVADAAGIADPKGSGQLSAQVIDFAAARAHLAMHSDYISVAEMSEANAVQTRLGSLLALRSSPNEQVGVRPSDGSQDLVDTFPLTGAYARLRWLPGDGVRLALESVDVQDQTPRQLRRIENDLRPNAIAPPVVGFRQRPRSPAAVLKRTLRAVYAQSRNYQGTASLLGGARASATGNGGIPTATAGGAVDFYARLPMPVNVDAIDRVWLALEVSSGVGVIEVNGANTALPVGGPDFYDITAYVTRDPAAASSGRIYARIINATVGAVFEYTLVARLRI